MCIALGEALQKISKFLYYFASLMEVKIYRSN